MSDEEVVKSLDSSTLRTIRTHTEIKYEPKTAQHFFLRDVKLSEDAQGLILISKDRQKISLAAPRDILAYLQKVLPNYKGKEWSEIIDEILAPTEPDLLGKKKGEILSQVATLRGKIKALKEEIDSIVFDLYDLSQEEQKVILEAEWGVRCT